MSDLLIRDLDPEAHRELKRRAERAGRSLRAYAAGVLTAHAARPAIAEWLAQLDEVEPVRDVSGSVAVAEAREELA